MGLGFTRVPYLFPGTNHMWVNVGRNQFRLPSGPPLVFRGHIGVVSPDREALLDRLTGVKKQLADHKFKFKEHNEYVETTCPWGNKIRLYSPDEERFGKINLGIPYVEFTVPEKTAKGISRFYRKVLGAITCIENNAEGQAAHIKLALPHNPLFPAPAEKLPAFAAPHPHAYPTPFPVPPTQLTTL